MGLVLQWLFLWHPGLNRQSSWVKPCQQSASIKRIDSPLDSLLLQQVDWDGHNAKTTAPLVRHTCHSGLRIQAD